MTLGNRPIYAAFLGLLLLGTGCITPRYTTHEVLKPVETIGVVAPARAKVYIFLMNGADLMEVNGIECLRDQIIAAGFPKVYYAQRMDNEYFRRELHRLRREDPDNRFYILGYGSGADKALELGNRVACEGVPLDGVFFVDPCSLRPRSLDNVAFFTMTFRSKNWIFSKHSRPSEEITTKEVGHYNILTYYPTVETITSYLTNSAHHVPVPDQPVDCLPMRDDPRPIPRPNEPKEMTVKPGYEFLCPRFRPFPLSLSRSSITE